jgi:hypothetical protein
MKLAEYNSCKSELTSLSRLLLSLVQFSEKTTGCISWFTYEANHYCFCIAKRTGNIRKCPFPLPLCNQLEISLHLPLHVLPALFVLH